MNDIIKIKNTSFRYENRFVFDKLNLNIHEGEWLSIVGPNGSGKSTLIRIILGLLKADGEIIVDGLTLEKDNLISIRKKIGVLFENADETFVSETVADDIAFTLENLSYKPKEMDKLIHEIAHVFKIEELLEIEPHMLSGGEKQKVALAAALVSKPKILIIDDALEMIDEESKSDILKVISKMHKENHLTIISVTHNLEETYLSDRMIVINNGDILIEGPTKKVLEEDKIFNRIGIEIPFMVDLSNKLKLYGLVDHIILNMNEMVKTLWK